MKKLLIRFSLFIIGMSFLYSCDNAQGYKPRFLEQRSLPTMYCFDGIIYYEWNRDLVVRYRVNEIGEVEVDTCARYNKEIINNIGTDRE